MYNTNSNKKHSGQRNMYKKICALMVILGLIFCYLAPVSAASTVKAAENADILLVYDAGMDKEVQKNISSVTDILTYLGYSVRYCPVNESAGIVDKYPYIVYYHFSDEIDTAFLSSVKKTSGKILALGGGDISGLLKALKLPISCTCAANTSATFSYSFSGDTKTGLSSGETGISLLQGTFSYSSGNILINGTNAPYCARQGRISCIAVYDRADELLKAMFAHEIAVWKWPYDDALHSYAQYIVFDNVYPFFNTQKMMDIIDMMKSLGVPYVITVMPVYQNSGYPAMKHFCEVLRYAQANGGAIALKEPIINTDNPTLKEINKHISTAFSAYCSYGVYPIALETSEKSIHQTLGLNVMKRFRTVIFTPDDEDSGWTAKEKNNAVYSDGHQLIAPALSDGGSESGLTSVYPTAIFLDMLSDINDMRTRVREIRDSSLPLMSLWSSPQSVYTDDSVLSFDNNSLSVNKKTVSLEFTPFKYEKNYDYQNGIFSNAMAGINNGNRKLLIAVTVISIIFIVLIVIARHQNKRKFLYKPDNKNEDEGKK
jgi:hypothetical protein